MIKKPLRVRLWQLVQNATGHRIVTSDSGAFDLGAFAVAWRIRWRVLTVRHENADGSISPSKSYFLAGDLQSQLGEFFESVGK